MKIVALAGGVGGAKMANGFAQCLPSKDLTIVVNTGDDFNHLGLWICPDLDTVTYTLSGLSNPQTGWGLKNESWNSLAQISILGGPTWFQLGDKDLGLHLERTRRLANGEPLSRITASFCKSFNIEASILPMTDAIVQTHVLTKESGDLLFQEYFVKNQCRPTAIGFRFDGIEKAQPAPEVLERIQDSDYIILCPSNPFVSIDPILSVPEMRETMIGKKVIAISPIIGGKALKGPAAKMFTELGILPTSASVAQHYQPLLTGIAIDTVDSNEVEQISHWGIIPYVTDTVMSTHSGQKRLAMELLKFCETL